MEVADQWRRQWAGTAEYGKVTEGGVTRRIARAMEVLHASAPGARVRVMRAAYHSSSGPGLPSSSYLMQSSRRVISSGYNFSEPLSLPSKPLEVSSTPIESSPDGDSEVLNYKVTEPDDTEISEPSKWRSSTGKNSIRMPSEESSSADNASIIDLDSRNSSRSTFRRSFNEYDSNEDNIKNIHIRNNRVSPLLDAPISLSTLKYTSLLNGSDEWNNGRKSYSFEDTAPLNNHSISHNDSFVMDSSTDSGICKSTEVVNDQSSRLDSSLKHRLSTEKLSDSPEKTFQDWLHKNRSNSIKSNRLSPLKDYHHEQYRTNESNISLQANGKVTITLPVMVESDESSNSTSNENDRRTKKVGFSKTELHFAAESGTVNIIATDEKGPPSSDFRKKKSVFVPFNTRVDKSITLFGEKPSMTEITSKNDFVDCDENAAATKSILKNRIPKPKPYLLGENMALGVSNANVDDDTQVFSRVSLINKDLEFNNKHTSSKSLFEREPTAYETTDWHGDRTLNSGPQKSKHSFSTPSSVVDKRLEDLGSSLHNEEPKSITANRNKLLRDSALGTFKTRQLRDSDLTYFGIETDKISNSSHCQDALQEEILHSVKLVQKISNSVCNSEAESDDTPEYQNLTNIKYSDVPIPKPRTKHSDLSETHQVRILKPIIEGENDTYAYRRSRLKKTFDNAGSVSRSISEPPKRETSQITRDKTKNTSPKRSSNRRDHDVKYEKSNADTQNKPELSKKSHPESLYMNINNHSIKVNSDTKSQVKRGSSSKKEKSDEGTFKSTRQRQEDKKYGSIKNKQTREESRKPKRTEKLITPDLSTEPRVDSFSKKVKPKNRDNDSSSVEHTPTINSRSVETNLSKDRRGVSKGTSAREPVKDKESGKKTSLSSNNYTVSHTNVTKPVKVGVRDTGPRDKSLEKTKSKENEREKTTSKSRSKYVINYDDKNGTVSSICKIKSGQENTLKKNHSPTHYKHNTDSTVKSKNMNKSGFLQFSEQQRNKRTPKLNKKWNIKEKSKMYVHKKSCQLL